MGPSVPYLKLESSMEASLGAWIRGRMPNNTWVGMNVACRAGEQELGWYA